MKFVKFALIAASLLAAILCLSYDVLSAGGQGVFVFICCLLPGVLGVFGTVIQSTLPRWAAIVSSLSFLLVGLKTSGGPEGGPLENVMMVGFLGLILGAVLAVKPEKS